MEFIESLELGHQILLLIFTQITLTVGLALLVKTLCDHFIVNR